jgi:hypothetical protein
MTVSGEPLPLQLDGVISGRVQLARSDAVQVFGAGAGFRGASV